MDTEFISATTGPTQFAVVTGASSGIGLELAEQFAGDSFDLLIAAEDPGIFRAAKDLGRLGHSVSPLQVDLATFEGVEKLYAAIQRTGRPIDAIAINAGVGVSGDFARMTDLQAELNLINLNVTSSVHIAKLVLKEMVHRNQGKVLFTGLRCLHDAGRLLSRLCGVKGICAVLRGGHSSELKDTGVTVTALLPGATDTNFFRRAQMEDAKVGAGEKDDPAEVAKQGFDALMAGKDKVVGGSITNKLQTVAAGILPETVTAQMHRKQAEPGTAEK